MSLKHTRRTLAHDAILEILFRRCFRWRSRGHPCNQRGMNSPPRVALIIETSVIYGRRILNGIARYLRSHHRWSVFLEQHELGAPPPAWLSSSKWDGILSGPTDPEMARLFRRMRVPVVDLNDLHEDLGLAWVGSDHAGIGRLVPRIYWSAAIAISLSPGLPASFGRPNAGTDSAPRSSKRVFRFQCMNRRGAE